MTPGWLRCGLLLLLVVSTAQAGQKQASVRPTQARVDAIAVGGLIVQPGLDEAGVRALLGEPIGRDDVPVRNRRTGYTDHEVALHYEGLDVHVYTFTRSKLGSKISRVRVMGGDYPLPYGLQIGMSEMALANLLGRPMMINPSRYGHDWLYFPSNEDPDLHIVVRMVRKQVAEIFWSSMPN